jgi:AbrB family looped-hinge helix DNA binding protein
MNETLVVSRRGQITLPALLRRRLGIKAGDVMILEDRGHEVVLKPRATIEVETYSDDQIAKWDADDQLSEEERKRIVEV